MKFFKESFITQVLSVIALTNNRLPPGPQLSIQDFMANVKENPFDLLMDLIQKYGDIIYLKLQKDVYILSNPDYIETFRHGCEGYTRTPN